MHVVAYNHSLIFLYIYFVSPLIVFLTGLDRFHCFSESATP